MHNDDPWAWGEFVDRFEGQLLVFARLLRIPPEEQRECVFETLESVGLKLTEQKGEPPRNMRAYLARALRSHYLTRKRTARRRDTRHAAASQASTVEGIVGSVCSQATMRASRGEGSFDRRVAEEGPKHESHREVADLPRGIDLLVHRLVGLMSEDEQRITGWLSEYVPHRQIAEWLGVSYEAASKRIWRLCRRLRLEAERIASQVGPDDMHEIRAFLRRAGSSTEDKEP